MQCISALQTKEAALVQRARRAQQRREGLCSQLLTATPLPAGQVSLTVYSAIRVFLCKSRSQCCQYSAHTRYTKLSELC